MEGRGKGAAHDRRDVHPHPARHHFTRPASAIPPCGRRQGGRTRGPAALRRPMAGGASTCGARDPRCPAVAPGQRLGRLWRGAPLTPTAGHRRLSTPPPDAGSGQGAGVGRDIRPRAAAGPPAGRSPGRARRSRPARPGQRRRPGGPPATAPPPRPRSPGRRPGKARSGRAVTRWLPSRCWWCRNSAVTTAQTVWLPRSCGPVVNSHPGRSRSPGRSTRFERAPSIVRSPSMASLQPAGRESTRRVQGRTLTHRDRRRPNPCGQGSDVDSCDSRCGRTT